MLHRLYQSPMYGTLSSVEGIEFKHGSKSHESPRSHVISEGFKTTFTARKIGSSIFSLPPAPWDGWWLCSADFSSVMQFMYQLRGNGLHAVSKQDTEPLRKARLLLSENCVSEQNYICMYFNFSNINQIGNYGFEKFSIQPSLVFFLLLSRLRLDKTLILQW